MLSYNNLKTAQMALYLNPLMQTK